MRCQWITADGQCPRQAEEGTFCRSHGHLTPDQELKHYQITNVLVGDRHARHNAVAQIKDLREEVSLTRALIETRLNLASNEAEFIASMGILHQYLTTVDKLVASSHRMDTNLGNVLSKASVLNLAQDLVKIIAEELNGVPGRDDIVDRVAHRIITCIGEKDNE